MFWKKEPQTNLRCDFEALKETVGELSEKLKSLELAASIDRKGTDLKTDIFNVELKTIRENIISINTVEAQIDTRLKKVTAYFHDAMQVAEATVSDRFAGVLKHITQKMELLLGDGDKTKMINELLRRIAYLEGVKEAEGNMRTPEEILGTLHALNTKAMAFDREDKTDPILNEQIKMLHWVLGEEKDANNS